MFELITGDFLFDPQKGTRHNRDDGKRYGDYIPAYTEMLMGVSVA